MAESEETYTFKLIRFYGDGIICHNLAYTDDDYKKGSSQWGYKRDISFNVLDLKEGDTMEHYEDDRVETLNKLANALLTKLEEIDAKLAEIVGGQERLAEDTTSETTCRIDAVRETLALCKLQALGISTRVERLNN